MRSTAYLDGQILQAKLYAEYWISQINSGAYKLQRITVCVRKESFDPKIHRRTLESIIDERGLVTGVELTVDEKLRSASETVLRHIHRIEELSELKQKIEDGDEDVK